MLKRFYIIFISTLIRAKTAADTDTESEAENGTGGGGAHGASGLLGGGAGGGAGGGTGEFTAGIKSGGSSPRKKGSGTSYNRYIIVTSCLYNTYPMI